MSRLSDVTSLILTDDHPASWMQAVLKGSASASQWEILPLGFGPEQYKEQHSHELNQLPDWRVTDVSSAVGRARSLVRECVPQLLLDLRRRPLEGGKSLPEILQDRGFNAWWFLEISEKSAYRGPLINRLYYLALIQEVVNQGAYKEVWLCLKDRLLAETVAETFKEQKVRFIRIGAKPPGRIRGMLSGLARYAKNAVGIAALHCLQLLMVRGLRIAHDGPSPTTDALVFSLYPLMWTDPYSERAAEWYFGSLPALFPKEHTVRHAVWLTISPWEIWRRRRELRAFIQERSAICLTLSASVTAVGILFSPKWWRAQIRLELGWRQRLGLSFLSFDVSAIVVDELRRSLSSTELFRDLLMYRAWANLARSTSFKAVLYRLEFQPFESAIIYGTKGLVRTVAFQHFLFGKNFLPCFFVPDELKPNSDPQARPMPDLILTAGAFGREVMLKNGCRSETVEVCGPVRHRKLFLRDGLKSERQSESRARLDVGTGVRVLVVATAVSKQEAEGLLAALQGSADELNPFVVMFKSHPALSLDGRFMEVVGRQMDSSCYRILKSVDELYDALTVAEAAVLNHSTVTIEAMVLGVLPIVFDSGAVFDPKAMEPQEYGGVVVRNSEELRGALRKTARMNGEAQALREQLVTQSGQWFDRSDGDPHQRLIDILRKHGVLNVQAAGKR